MRQKLGFTYKVVNSDTLSDRFCVIIYFLNDEVSRHDGWLIYANAETWGRLYTATK